MARRDENEDRPRRSNRDDDDRPRERDRDRDEKPRSSGGKFEYEARTAKDVDNRATQKGGMFDAIIKSEYQQFKAKAGNHTVRFLPRSKAHLKKDEVNHYGIDIYLHRDIGADHSNYLCPKEMLGEDCPICAERAAMADPDEAKQFKVGRQVLTWVIDRDEENVGPKLWTMPWTVDRDISVLCKDKKSGEILSIDHPEDGYDVDFVRDGKELQTKYFGYKIARSPSPILESEKKQERLLEFLADNDLRNTLQYFDEAELEAALGGTKRRKDADLDKDDDKPRGRVGRASLKDDDEQEDRRSRRGSKDDDDDAPKARRGSKDDDGEEAPRSRRGRDEEDDKPKRRAAKDEEDDAPKARRGRGEEDDDQPRRRGRGEEEEEKTADGHGGEVPLRRASKDDDDDNKPRRGRASLKDEEDDKPKRRAAKDEEDELPEEKPAAKRGGASESAKTSLRGLRGDKR